MKKIKITISTTNGSELYSENFMFTVENESITPQMVESFIEQFKNENTDYYTDDLLNDLTMHFSGNIENVTFNPDVDVII